jgi:DNA/RNA endonuclease YhcR with UshA esterase domain
MALQAFKIGSLVLAIAGVAVLLLVAGRVQPPAVQAGSLGGTMNWAYVRLGGVVSSQPTLDGETGALRFWLEDGTGEIMVMAYRSEAEALLAEGRVPVMGDQVSLDGTLRVKDDFRYLELRVPQQVQIEAAEPQTVPIAAVDGDRQYERVIVEGVIRDERVPYEGLRVLTLHDTTGQIDVALAEEAAAFGGLLPELVPGQALRVAGAVDLYRGQPQISVGRCDDLVVLDDDLPIAEQRSISELASVGPGDLAAIQGTIIGVDAFSQGVKLALDDGTGTVILLLWQNLYEAFSNRGALVEGATLRALGRVNEYHGELELVPELPQDVEILATAIPQVVGRRSLGEISSVGVGQLVQVEGQIVNVQPFSAGVKYRLDDGTGQLTLLLWQDLYDQVPKVELLAPGARVSVQGTVDHFGGELEIVPRLPEDLEVRPGPTPGPTATATLEPTATPTPTDEPTATATPEPAQTEVPTTPTPTREAVATATPSPPPPPTTGAAPTSTAVLAASPVPEPETRTLGAITEGDVGQAFTVAQAGIGEVDYFSKGVKYRLEDGTGNIILLIWQDVMEEVAVRYDLFPGSQVQVRGQIDEYEGELEIVPQAGEDVVLLARGERAPVEERATGSVGPPDEGRVFVVEGAVTWVEGDGWLKLWLDDGSGELLVFVPTRSVAYLPQGIGAGVRLRVTGQVDVYQGTVEIIPLAGADVELP